MLYKIWNELPINWKHTAYKCWLLFVKNKFSVGTFLIDDSYGIDFLLCKALNIETSNPEQDLHHLNDIIECGIKEISISTLDEIFSMRFISISPDITFLSPLKFFLNILVLDFHAQNESKITDFSILENRGLIYVLDYSDYQIIDFEKYSNIRHYKNIYYLKGLKFSKTIVKIISKLVKNGYAE